MTLTNRKGPKSYLHEFRAQAAHAALKVACARCKAAVLDPCVKPNGGQANQPHQARLDAAQQAGHWGVVGEKFEK